MAKVEAHEYEVTRNFLPDYSTIHLQEGDFLYLVDYYGQLTDAHIEEALGFCGKRLVVDEVQNFFRMPIEGVDTLYSCRKFFGVPDGAYLYTNVQLSREIAQDESRHRMTHVLGRAERPASEYYTSYTENDKAFVDEPVKLMSPITHDILRAIDYGQAKERRTRNFRLLDNLLGDLNELSPSTPEGAYMYPLLISEEAVVIRAQLQRSKIYVPTLWPNSAKLGGTTGMLSRNILPLPVDQRYDESDMAYVAEYVRHLLEQ